MFGQTETTGIVATYPLEAPQQEQGASVPIGHPIASSQLYLLDGSGQLAPISVRGEVYVGGSDLARGYLGRPELTAERFVPHPFSSEPGARLYRTGDLARYRLDGTIEFLGRIDQQVKIRGYRIELGEIETVLAQHPAIKACVVLTQEDVSGERYLVAYLVLFQEHMLTVRDLRSFLKDRLPSYMIPSAFVTLDALPLTPNGKVDRRMLPQPKESQDKEHSVQEEIRTQIEELLVGLWSEVLRRTQVGIHEHFFELGGHSLLATRLIARVRATLGVEVPLRAVFETPTVAGLAQRIEQALRKGEGMEVPPLVVRERPEEIPLSFAQQRLWFLDQLQPESTAYLVPRAQHLHGLLDTEAVEKSLEEMVRRHETLRTTFALRSGQPVQVINTSGRYCLPLIDLRGLEQEKRQYEACYLAKKEAQHPCDLEHGPLLRSYLLQLDSEEHVLLLTLHHIITDAWSNLVLIRELVTLYRAFTTEQPSPLTPLPIQYADYALWQRQWLQGEVLEAQLDYWTKRLGGVPSIELPADYPHPPVLSSRGAAHRFVLSEDLSQALSVFSHQEGVTLFMTLLAAFQVLFYRSTGQSDIVIGTDSANRNRVETEGIIGFFINVLPLRTDLSGRPSFREVLKQVREIVLGAYTHRETPFELLVEKLAPDHYLDRTPLVQVLFVLQNIPVELANAGPRREPEALDQSSLRPLIDEETMVKFDVALFMQERAGRLSGALNYRLDLFKASTIAKIAARFETLLQSIVKQPDIPIDLLEMASDTDRAQQDKEEQELRHELRIGNDGWFDLSEIDFAKHSSSE
jgi:acyl carrier protein